LGFDPPKLSQVKPFKNVNASSLKKTRLFLFPDQSHKTKTTLIFRDLGFEVLNSQHNRGEKLFLNIFLEY
jgi:hypothetical protein